MTVLAFDTLDASRQLRDAGADERLAEAVVRVVSQTVVLPSIEHLATKAEMDALRAEVKGLSDRVNTLQAFVVAGTAIYLGGLVGLGGFLYAVLK